MFIIPTPIIGYSFSYCHWYLFDSFSCRHQSSVSEKYSFLTPFVMAIELVVELVIELVIDLFTKELSTKGLAAMELVAMGLATMELAIKVLAVTELVTGQQLGSQRASM